MAVKRSFWKPPFSGFVSWLCPTCQDGTLAQRTESFVVQETGPSNDAHHHEGWDPEWILERFSALLVCQNQACGEIVAIGGTTSHVEAGDWERQELDWQRRLTPNFFFPPPPIFPIPEGCPESVAEELRKAFGLYWVDGGSCANRLRAATEALLSDRRIPKTSKGKSGKKVRLSLHSRIAKFKLTDPESADYLLAIKWIGNAGSHASLLNHSHDELLNGFELFEHVIERVYVKRAAHLKKLAKHITARKGRPSSP